MSMKSKGEYRMKKNDTNKNAKKKEEKKWSQKKKLKEREEKRREEKEIKHTLERILVMTVLLEAMSLYRSFLSKRSKLPDCSIFMFMRMNDTIILSTDSA